MPKFWIIKCDILSYFQTMWRRWWKIDTSANDNRAPEEKKCKCAGARHKQPQLHRKSCIIRCSYSQVSYVKWKVLFYYCQLLLHWVHTTYHPAVFQIESTVKASILDLKNSFSGHKVLLFSLCQIGICLPFENGSAIGKRIIGVRYSKREHQ